MPTEGFSEIFAELNRESMSFITDSLNEMMSNPFDDDVIIYHYTTSAGLRGILESNTLWATNLLFVNDSKELSYGLALFEETIKWLERKWDDFNQRDKELLKTVLALLLTAIKTRPTSNVYACCFSKDGDQLSQWRGYGANPSGYSIGFIANEFTDNFDIRTNAIAAIYDEEDQMSLIERVVESYFDTFLIDERVASLPTIGTEIADHIYKAVESLLVAFKHSGFWEEQERRFYTISDDPKNISFREKNGILVPYIEFQMREHLPLPIREIIIGPTDDFERAEVGLKLFLEKNNYQNVEIKKSEIPFRSR